jgi:hypothetical protein
LTSRSLEEGYAVRYRSLRRMLGRLESSLRSHRRHRGNKAVSQQDGFQFFNIGRAARIHNGSGLLEEIRAEQRGGNNGQRLHISLLQVASPADGELRSTWTRLLGLCFSSDLTN